MELEALTKAVAEWAAQQPVVLRAYLYGSRVRGTHRPDIDLDVAVELIPRKTDPSALNTWIREGKRLQSSLQSILPVTEKKGSE